MSSPIDTITSMQRRIFRLRVVATTFISLFTLTAISYWGMMITYDEDIAALEYKVKWLSDDRSLYQASMLHWKEKCDQYQSANEQLIKYAEPKSLNRAIKATPLPPLKG